MAFQRVTSKDNPQFRALREALAEGGPARSATLLAGAKLIEAWHGARGTEAGRRFRPARWLRLEGAAPHPLEAELELPGMELPEPRMRELTDMRTPPDHALVVDLGPEPAGALAPRTLAGWGIQDPGNLGAILRSAAAFGFGDLLLGPGSADPFSPKALRGAMGAAFCVRIRRAEAVPSDAGRWYALDGGPGALLLGEADLAEPVRLMVGNEGHGWQGVALPPHVRRLAIPMEAVESLNAAVAAGIACYEVHRREGR